MNNSEKLSLFKTGPGGSGLTDYQIISTPVQKLKLNKEAIASLNQNPLSSDFDFDTPTINDACFSVRSRCVSGFTCGSGTFRAACQWHGFFH